MVFVVSGKPVLVILFAKGPMEAGMFSVVGREGERILGVLGMFRNDFGVSNIGGSSFVAVDHSCSKLIGVLRLFVFAFIHVFWVIEIEGKILFEFENRVIPHFRVRKVSIPSWFCGVIQHFVNQVNV